MKNIKNFILEASTKSNKNFDFSDMCSAILDDADSFIGLTKNDVVKKINEEVWDKKDYLPKDTIKKLFKGYENKKFIGCVLSNNGYEGELEKAYDRIWGSNKSIDDCSEVETFEWNGNGCCGVINRCIDNENMLMIVTDMDPCYVFISDK